MEEQQPRASAKLRKWLGAIIMIAAVLYLIWATLAAAFESSNWGLRPGSSAAWDPAKSRKHMFPVFLVTSLALAAGLFLISSWKLNKWIGRLGILAMSAFAGSFLWPVMTDVTGNTKVHVLKEDGTPLAGLRAEQEWGLYTYYDKGGIDVRTTDATGTVSFPPRQAKGSVGLRSLRRAAISAFFKYTYRAGPIAGIQIDLPPGYWLPAEWPPAQSQKQADGLGYYEGRNLSSPIFGNRLHEYLYMRNDDRLHPNIYIGGNEGGFANDTDIVIHVRPANSFEENAIRWRERAAD